MLTPGQTLTVTIEKPAVGGRMIARVSGQIVLVSGAVPGERVQITIERVGKGVAYGDTLTVEEPSPDRRAHPADPLCGGCLYAHIAYERQLRIKSLVIADAFGRIGRFPISHAVSVAASPAEGYRMRARLHYRGRRLGFFREGTHDVCDARATGQLLPATCDVLERLEAELFRVPDGAVREIDVAENVDASERVVHLEASPGADGALDVLLPPDGISGLTTTSSGSGGVRVLAGSAYVTDRLAMVGQRTMAIRRHVLAFFQGNRYLLHDLVTHVTDQIPHGSATIDLYAGGGLFAISAAQRRGARVTAVEGDRAAAEDLAANAADAADAGDVTAVHQPVETFVWSAPPGAGVVIVDPPRTGMSREALQGVLRLRGRLVVYVSCDVATLARDARYLVDAGYAIVRIDGFDLFPNTPHVETVVVFERDGSEEVRNQQQSRQDRG
jgi:23S rRNA (uracil1939-C5)-methyltransferase